MIKKQIALEPDGPTLSSGNITHSEVLTTETVETIYQQLFLWLLYWTGTFARVKWYKVIIYLRENRVFHLDKPIEKVA